jgi:hypothetical protein
VIQIQNPYRKIQIPAWLHEHPTLVYKERMGLQCNETWSAGYSIFLKSERLGLIKIATRKDLRKQYFIDRE